MSFIIFDTEYTSWKGCLENGRADWQKEEIVQIAALKINSQTLEVEDELNIYIKPKINPILSDFFIDLTKITNEIINQKGVDFKTAYKDFYNFSKGLMCFSHGWNLNKNDIADGEVIELNLEYNKIIENEPLNYLNIAHWFMKMYKEQNIDIKKQASGDIVRLLGLEENINHLGISIHNALYDVYSILEGIKFFKGKELFDNKF
ncbi:MAG: 3'-5' exonuclease [Alphaproteobacteria bacterium]